MKKVKVLWVTAVSMALLGLAEAVSGFVLWLGFPSGGGRGWGGGFGELTFWGLSRHTWIDIHDWVAVALLALVLVHIILHWKWLLRMAKALFPGKPQRSSPVLVNRD